jgi:hypothetical protein
VNHYVVVTKMGSENAIEQVHADEVWIDDNGNLTFGLKGQGMCHQFAPGHWLRWFITPTELGVTTLKHTERQVPILLEFDIEARSADDFDESHVVNVFAVPGRLLDLEGNIVGTFVPGD